MNIFEQIIILILFGGLGLSLILIAIYIKRTDSNFKNKGVKLEFEVKSCKKQKRHNKDNKVIGEFYITEFEYIYNNQTLTETISTDESYSIGDKVEGLYLPTAKFNKTIIGKYGLSLNKNNSKVVTKLIIIGIILILIAGIIGTI